MSQARRSARSSANHTQTNKAYNQHMSDPQSTPLAAQLLRKAQRLSLAGAGRSGYNNRPPAVTDLSKLRLTLFLTPALNKRLSVYGSGGPMASNNIASTGPSIEVQSGVSTPFSQHGFASSYAMLGTNSWPQRRAEARPLRDKNYQALILKEVYDFCIGNRFELETGHPITLKTLKQPTQKDFVLLFQFLYGKIDPNYKFTRSVESEMFLLLRNLGYPYLDGINRSAISAVGGQNWPSFLGMLYWLVKVNLNMLNLQNDAIVAPDDIFDCIFITYILSSYTAFIEQREDYSDYYNEMKTQYDAAISDLSKQAEEKKLLQRELAAKFEKINEQYGELEEAKRKSKALENDLKQFSEYIYKVKERQSQWKDILEQVENDIAISALRLQELETERKALEELIKEKGFSITEIDSLNLERDKYSRLFDTVIHRIEDLKGSLVQRESDISRNLQSLQSFVNQYNSMIARIPSKENDDYELVTNPALLEGGSLAIEPDAVLNKLVRTLKIKLLEVRSEFKQELLRVQGETIRIIELVDHISERIFEQQEEIESVEMGVTKLKDTQDEIYENMVSEGAIRSTQCEKLERDLQAMRIHANKGVIELETRNKELKILLRESKYDFEQRREQLHAEVVSYLQEIIMVKLNIQEQLEDLESLTSQELELQLRKEEGFS